ncbi:MAG: YerC/YecD family TrpR-related protein [Caloramator sp.]|nr:YerC/YecD family TrpR-related protein [Caloramator sp.]
MSEYKSKIKSDDVDLLFEAILTLETIEDCYRFFEDICTVNEIKAIAQRLHVAKMLRERRTYIDIADTTGASTATISRVNRFYNYGNDGYKRVLERLKEKGKLCSD